MKNSVLVLALICLLVRGSTGGLAEDVGTPEVGYPIPGRTSEGIHSPLFLLNSLLVLPFDESLLPEEFSEPTPMLWDYGDDDLAGAIGGAIIRLNGNDSASINYIVYQSSADTESGVFANLPDDLADVPVATSLPANRVLFSLDDYVVCAELSVETAVIAGSVMTETQRAEDIAPMVCALLDAGSQHLDSIRRQP